MNCASPESLRMAQEIVDSARVLRTYAACEWDELSEDGKQWISAIVQEAQARAMTRSVRDAMRRNGVKPAPFALSPMLIERALKAVETPAPTLAPTVTVATPPAAVDGPIEPARYAPMQAAPSAPAKSIPPALGRPDTFGTSETLDGKIVPLSVTSKPARRLDVQHRQAKDRDARALETPIDQMLLDRRRAMIREASARLRPVQKIALPTANNFGRAPLSRPAAKRPALPSLGPEQRRILLDRAIAFLKRDCILVTVCDRDAQIRKYRVSGKREAMLACEVIDFAVERGLDA